MILGCDFQVWGLIYVLHCPPFFFFKDKVSLSVKLFHPSKQIPLNPENQTVGYNRQCSGSS